MKDRSKWFDMARNSMEIERLKAENGRLRKALQTAWEDFKVYGKDDAAIKRIREALAEGKK